MTYYSLYMSTITGVYYGYTQVLPKIVVLISCYMFHRIMLIVAAFNGKYRVTVFMWSWLKPLAYHQGVDVALESATIFPGKYNNADLRQFWRVWSRPSAFGIYC